MHQFITLIFSFFVAAGAIANDLVSADTAAGQTLYQSKCLACHGVAGVSIIPANPILAGQHGEYLYKQVQYFRDGMSKNAIMSAMAQGLSDAEIANVAAYLSEQQPVIAGAADMELAQSAEKLYRGGVIADGIPSCASCHGPAGEGIEPVYPRLSGQHAEYTASSLRAYASGERENSIMQAIATKLSDEQITSLAAYISGLAP